MAESQRARELSNQSLLIAVADATGIRTADLLNIRPNAARLRLLNAAREWEGRREVADRHCDAIALLLLRIRKESGATVAQALALPEGVRRGE